jgi:hypothetical protein
MQVCTHLDTGPIVCVASEVFEVGYTVSVNLESDLVTLSNAWIDTSLLHVELLAKSVFDVPNDVFSCEVLVALPIFHTIGEVFNVVEVTCPESGVSNVIVSFCV